MATSSSRLVLHDGPCADETISKWKRLIDLISFKYPYIISRLDVEEKIRVLLADLDLIGNIENLKFWEKYEEFTFLFDYSLRAFKSNIEQIDSIQSFADEYWDKEKQSHRARKVLRGRRKDFKKVEKEYSKLMQDREKLVTRLNILDTQIETESETAKPTIEKEGILKRLNNLDREIQVHQGLVARLSQLLEWQQSLSDELNEEYNHKSPRFKRHDVIKN